MNKKLKKYQDFIKEIEKNDHPNKDNFEMKDKK